MRYQHLILAAVAAGAALLAAGGLRPSTGPAEPQAPPSRIPQRPAGAPAGSELIRELTGMAPARRAARIHAELLAGNVPDYLRRLTPVELEAEIQGRGRTTAVVWVTPDYLAVGTDEDFVRVPLGYYSACGVARAWGLLLPTRRIVDAAYAQADVRLEPAPMTPGPEMSSTAYFADHNRAIERQLAGRAADGLLVAGHKKDLVITNRLWTRKSRVAIYGWHRRGGRAIQPLSTVHEATYADYSHGVRLVSATMLLGRERRPTAAVLEDPQLARLLTSEGRIRDVEGLMTLPAPKGWLAAAPVAP